MWKLRKSIVKNPVTSKTVNKQPQQSAAEKREEKILYYRDLFRLDFRVYDEDEIEAEGGIDDSSYFERGSSFNIDDEDVIYYRDKFAGLDALDVFYNLCFDYCQDELVVLQKRIEKYPLLTDLYTKEFVETKNSKHQKTDPRKKEHFMHNLMKQQMERVENNQRAQGKMQAQIALIKKKMTELGYAIPADKTHYDIKVILKPTEQNQTISDSAALSNTNLEDNAPIDTEIKVSKLEPVLSEIDR